MKYMKMQKRYYCTWCIQGMQSHGEIIYSGSYVQGKRCCMCNDEEDVVECVEEVIE